MTKCQAGRVFRRLCFVLLLSHHSAYALDVSDFSGLGGWTIAAVTQVRGEFEGCDFDRTIKFDNGWTLTCATYSYSYAYRPDAVIFIKNSTFQNRAYWMVKALIDDEFYEMRSTPAKRGP